MEKMIVAYEPIWAIGTGETASPEQAQEMHRSIRIYLKELFGKSIADSIPVLYGGSVKPSNAKEIFDSRMLMVDLWEVLHLTSIHLWKSSMLFDFSFKISENLA